MSTRSCIARLTGPNAFKGVYHHWDGYPTALGATLWRLYHGVFGRDLERMLSFLIDDHPAGWSMINRTDFGLAPGFSSNRSRDVAASEPPQCYCHGERSEEPNLIDQDSDCGMEWAYVFDTERRLLLVYERLYETSGTHKVGMFGVGTPGHQYWAPAAEINLNRTEPDWEKVTARNFARTCSVPRSKRKETHGPARKSHSTA